LGENKRVASWIVKKTGDQGEILITVVSEKGGRDSKRMTLE
jgi:hypothetical protein